MRSDSTGTLVQVFRNVSAALHNLDREFLACVSREGPLDILIGLRDLTRKQIMGEEPLAQDQVWRKRRRDLLIQFRPKLAGELNVAVLNQSGIARPRRRRL